MTQSMRGRERRDRKLLKGGRNSIAGRNSKEILGRGDKIRQIYFTGKKTVIPISKA